MHFLATLPVDYIWVLMYERGIGKVVNHTVTMVTGIPHFNHQNALSKRQFRLILKRVPEAIVRMDAKSAFFHIRNISQVRRYLSIESTKTLVHAFVTSRIDNCNALLYGLPSYLVQRLQYVLNSAARLIFLSRKADHITPLLIDLH